MRETSSRMTAEKERLSQQAEEARIRAQEMAAQLAGEAEETMKQKLQVSATVLSCHSSGSTNGGRRQGTATGGRGEDRSCRTPEPRGQPLTNG